VIFYCCAVIFLLEIDRYIGRYLGRYRSKWLILLASVSIDKTLIYSWHVQTTCARKHSKPSQDRYLAATLADAFL